MQKALRELAGHPLVGEVRGVGLIGAVELVADKNSKKPFDPPGSVGMAVYEKAHDNGLIIRAIQDTIAFCPPLIISPEQVKDMIDRFQKTLDNVHTNLAV